MEKYGVLQEDEKPAVKESAAATTCRDCGQNLREAAQVGVRLCPKCGTLPYEGKHAK